MKKKFSLLAVLFLAIFVAAPLYSSPYYDNGSQRFTITAGAEFPISTTLFSTGDTVWGFGYEEGKTNQSLGGFGTISYQMFINSYVAIGGEIGYAFNYYPDDVIFSNVPFLFKLTAMPLQGTIEIPLSIGLGFSYMSLSEGSASIPLVATFETGLDWYFTENWGVGIKTGIWLVAELWMDYDALATFIPVSLSVTYRQ